MFKKLKDKIAEEVKSSPNRIQQIAQAAQAVVSSASSTASEVSGSENFFSITEEDTPHNSPLRNVNQNPTNLKPPLNNGVQANRIRRSSNTSIASDASFRLPGYDNPAVYHLQTDIETSAGEESSISVAKSVQLDSVSKEQLYQAYKKVMDRYQKYRGKFTELAQRYRDLERDNNKARAVLVETQDKALRRLCELREQCSLEQQAKAHLEAALRLEMDELNCVNQTLKTKLNLLGDNPDTSMDEAPQNPNENANHSIEFEKLKSKIEELTKKLLQAETEVKELKAREEENTILLAENKLMIHTELENKETEVKTLKNRITNFEVDLKQSVDEKGKLQEENSNLKVKLNESHNSKVANDNHKETIGTLNDEVYELNEKIKNLQLELNMSNGAIEILEQEKNSLNETLSVDKKKTQKFAEDVKLFEDKIKMLEEQKEILNEEIRILKENGAQKVDLDKEIENLRDNTNILEKEKNTLQELISIETTNSTNLKLELQKLEEEKQNSEKIISNNRKEISELTNEVEKLFNNLKKFEQENNSVNELISVDKTKINELNEQIHKLNNEKQLQLVEFNSVLQKLSSTEFENKNLNQKLLSIENNLTIISNENQELMKIKEENNNLNLNLIKLNEEKVTLSLEIDNNNKEIENYKQEILQLNQKIASLDEDVKNLTIRNANSESEAIKLLEVSIKTTMEKLNEKQTENLNLNKMVEDLKNQINLLLKDSETSKNDIIVMKNKIENLKIEKRDLEKTLEKEIREKSEYKIQVTNILQEIGRLEEQLKEVKILYSNVQEEKLIFEEKLKENEIKFNEIQCENTIISDKNCLLEENNLRLTNSLKEVENNLKKEKSMFNEKLKEFEQENSLLNEIKIEFNSTKDTIVNLEQKLSQCVDENSRMMNAKEILDHDIRSLQDQLEIKEKEKLCLMDNYKMIEIEKNKSNETNKKLENDMKNLQKQIETNEENLKKINKEKLEVNQKIKILENQNENLSKDLNQITTTNELKLNELEIQLQRTMDEKKTLKESINKNQTDLEKKIENYEELKIENQYLNTLVKQLEEEHNRTSESKKDLEKKIENLNIEIDTYKNEIKSKNIITNDMQLKIDKTENDNQILQKKLNALEEDKTLLNKILELEQTLEKMKMEHETKITILEQEIVQYTENEKTTKLKLETYNNLLSNDKDLQETMKEKENLEEKLQKIMSEVRDVSNRNLFLEQQCENYLILEQSNERLKLANDKLSRQLDETLVSMQHHVDGISANTEFEYLKNIVFQYLTGNINKNNTTLVKVIAAVLKFNQQQTQVILEKEVQRNSLLGQLNLL